MPFRVSLPALYTHNRNLLVFQNAWWMARTVALQALEVTTRDDYAQRLKDHLKETSSHAGQVSRRIKQLGGNPETVSIPRPEGLAKAAESVSGVVAKAKA